MAADDWGRRKFLIREKEISVKRFWTLVVLPALLAAGCTPPPAAVVDLHSTTGAYSTTTDAWSMTTDAWSMTTDAWSMTTGDDAAWLAPDSLTTLP